MDLSVASGPLVGETSTRVRPRSEDELIRAARSDPRAFGELYLQHQSAIWRYLRHRTGESHAADDLVAEVFLELLRALPRFRPRGIGVRGWLYRVATRRVARWAKRRRRSDESFDEDLHTRARRSSAATAGDSNESDAFRAPDGATTGNGDPSDAAARVRAALSALHERWQTVLVLHYLQGLAIDEIADVLGVRPGTIKSRLARGRDELRRRLERAGDSR
jgi:RNA polymerase sigma-70 factor (ECF subfamily)